MLARDSCFKQSNRLRLHALASSSTMDNKKYRIKKYTHFDSRVSIDKVKIKIKNPCWVSKHGFYPFVHFKIVFQKYNKISNEKKDKVRNIFYSSHIDSYIYKYYGDLLNNYYNDIVKELGINKVATAYRNNLQGKSNINFAKEVIDFIKKQQRAYIFVADFTSFFDRIDHKYLKEKIKYVLKKDTLPKDYYAVFKNVSNYSYIEKDKIDEVLKEKHDKDEIRKLSKFFTAEEFRSFKKDNIKRNKDDFGIPQGAGLSSVCSNIYLIDFDKMIDKFAKEHNGIYRRYCDDLIIVIPKEENFKENDHKIHAEFIDSVKEKIPKLEIHPDKTGHYYYANNKILDLKQDLKASKLDYLGFSFDGYNVRIREKSLFKYYTRAYRKVRICNRKSTEFLRKTYRRSLYENYTHLGKRRKGHGNFLSYVSRAQRIFNQDSLTLNLMEKQVKNHWKKIVARLKKHNKNLK